MECHSDYYLSLFFAMTIDNPHYSCNDLIQCTYNGNNNNDDDDDEDIKSIEECSNFYQCHECNKWRSRKAYEKINYRKKKNGKRRCQVSLCIPICNSCRVQRSKKKKLNKQ